MRHLALRRWLGIFLFLCCSCAHGRRVVLKVHTPSLHVVSPTHLPALHSHPLLKVYVEYAVLAAALSQQTQETFERFISTHDDVYLNNKLRVLWLKELTKRHQYRDVLAVARDMPVSPLSVVTCYVWEARASLHDLSVWQQVKRSYFLDVPLDCLSTIDGLTQSDWVTDEDRWQRARIFWDQRKWVVFIDHIKTMKNTAFDLHWLKRMMYSSRAFVVQHCAQMGRQRALTEAVLMAWSTYAGRDIRGALSLWSIVDKRRLSSTQLYYINARLAYEAARAHLPAALAWYRRVPLAALSDRQREWQIRAALYAGRWQDGLGFIQALPPYLFHKPVWIYWMARSQAELGQPKLAQPLYALLANRLDYYGLLSREKLGRRRLPLDTSAPDEAVIRRVAHHIGIRRAIALAKLGLWPDEVAEWRWATRAFNDEELLAAAYIAYQNQMYDCMIRTALDIRVAKNVLFSHPVLYRHAVERAAQRWQLNSAWIYGTIHQESRFLSFARSCAGAKGLMQLMPHTARRLAAFLHIPHVHVWLPERNILLGTTYLWQLYDKFHAQIVLASAAYNAGPIRVVEWMPSRELPGDLYVETIPFYETRLYVQKVIANTFLYGIISHREYNLFRDFLRPVKPNLEKGFLQDVWSLE